jgi:signal transduction histidine kinase
LLDNAIRYRDENKEESIISFNAYFESSSNEIVIVIEDNGIGMNEEELQQLGQVFKTFSDKSGIGLGMYIVKKIVDIMKWNIKIESKKGVFTKIVLSIPLINKVD